MFVNETMSRSAPWRTPGRLLPVFAACLGVFACGGEPEGASEAVCEPMCQGSRVIACGDDGAQEVGEDCSESDAVCERGRCVVRPPGLVPGSGGGASRRPSFPDYSGRERSDIEASPRQLPRQSSPTGGAAPVARQPDTYIRITPSGDRTSEEDFEFRRDPCPSDMEQVADVCMDRYEAPNRPGARPLVMYTMIQAEAWCEARGKRLCYDDEWTQACQGPQQTRYPYGDRYEPGRCNDDKTWRRYDGPVLQRWANSASSSQIYSYEQQLRLARRASRASADASEHIDSLYQGTAAGRRPGCGGDYGVYDLVGNVEEWTRRRDGGSGGFHGRLKGRFWAESRTCQSGVSSHGDSFRFYEIGFRCCMDPLGD